MQLDRRNPAEAATQLVKRYITRYGPVTLEDIAWWTGLGVGRCRTAFAQLDDRVMPVRVPGWGGDYVIDALTSTGCCTRLYAADRTVTMGFRNRVRLMDAAHHEFVYDRGGNATSVVLIDGRLAGARDVLAQRREAGFFLFATPANAVEERLGRNWPPWGPLSPVKLPR